MNQQRPFGHPAFNTNIYISFYSPGYIHDQTTTDHKERRAQFNITLFTPAFKEPNTHPFMESL